MLENLEFQGEESRTRSENGMLLKAISELTVLGVRGPQSSLALGMGPWNRMEHCPLLPVLR